MSRKIDLQQLVEQLNEHGDEGKIVSKYLLKAAQELNGSDDPTSPESEVEKSAVSKAAAQGKPTEEKKEDDDEMAEVKQSLAQLTKMVQSLAEKTEQEPEPLPANQDDKVDTSAQKPEPAAPAQEPDKENEPAPEPVTRIQQADIESIIRNQVESQMLQLGFVSSPPIQPIPSGLGLGSGEFNSQQLPDGDSTENPAKLMQSLVKMPYKQINLLRTQVNAW